MSDYPPAIVKAKIIGLWGDPGLSEKSNHDVASRFLIVQLSDGDGYASFASEKDWPFFIKLVLRPRSLWITANGSERMDYAGNKNVLDASSSCSSVTYSSRNISAIYPPYKMGEEITVSRFEKPITSFDGVDLFNSASGGGCSVMSDDYKFQSVIYSATSLVHYFNSLPTAISYEGGDVYTAAFNKITSTGRTIANGAASSILALKNGAIGGIEFPDVEYSDVNSEARSRAGTGSECLPLIVANPSTFPTAANRNIGGINLTL